MEHLNTVDTSGSIKFHKWRRTRWANTFSGHSSCQKRTVQWEFLGCFLQRTMVYWWGWTDKPPWSLRIIGVFPPMWITSLICLSFDCPIYQSQLPPPGQLCGSSVKSSQWEDETVSVSQICLDKSEKNVNLYHTILINVFHRHRPIFLCGVIHWWLFIIKIWS